MSQHPPTSPPLLRGLFWAYFLLLLFEGALRKWFLPGLSDVLLVVRDPIAIAAIAVALYNRVFPFNAYVIVIALTTIVSFIFTVTLGHGSIPVAIYGARIYLLHLPLIFIFGNALRQRDVERVGKLLLALSLPVALLLVAQLYSPQSAWVNLGVGGDEAGSGFSGALGYFRPSGLFSFTTGNQVFFSLVFAYAVAFAVDRRSVPVLLLVAGTAGALLAMPVSVSRTLLFQSAITVAFALVTSLGNRAGVIRLATAAAVLAVCVVAVSQTEVFTDASRIMSARFEGASAMEGGLRGTLVDRYLGLMVASFSEAEGHELGGAGLGLGTNVAGKLMAGERGFLLAEDEWGRILGEMGLIMGSVLILARFTLAARLGAAAWRALRRYRDPLPWVLFSYAILLLVNGQLGQPTNLGFTAVAGALVLAGITADRTATHRT